MSDEPKIVHQRKTLSPAEAMTVRNAIESFSMSLDEGLGDDEVGKALVEGYRRCIHLIRIQMGLR